MDIRTRIRAEKCLLEQSNYADPNDGGITFGVAYVVKDEIYLAEDAAELATHEYRPQAIIERVSYTEAYNNHFKIEKS